MHWFSVAARWTAERLGHSYAFIAAAALIVLWLITGPFFNWSDTWQLICNTVTTVITFLMVFLLQNSQNRDTLAIQAKLDALILAVDKADNRLIGVEKKTTTDV